MSTSRFTTHILDPIDGCYNYQAANFVWLVIQKKYFVDWQIWQAMLFFYLLFMLVLFHEVKLHAYYENLSRVF